MTSQTPVKLENLETIVTGNKTVLKFSPVRLGDLAKHLITFGDASLMGLLSEVAPQFHSDLFRSARTGWAYEMHFQSGNRGPAIIHSVHMHSVSTNGELMADVFSVNHEDYEVGSIELRSDLEYDVPRTSFLGHDRLAVLPALHKRTGKMQSFYQVILTALLFGKSLHEVGSIAGFGIDAIDEIPFRLSYYGEGPDELRFSLSLVNPVIEEVKIAGQEYYNFVSLIIDHKKEVVQAGQLLLTYHDMTGFIPSAEQRGVLEPVQRSRRVLLDSAQDALEPLRKYMPKVPTLQKLAAYTDRYVKPVE